MSLLRVRTVTPVSDDIYSVQLESDTGEQMRIECEVFVHHGIHGIRPRPDIFMTEAVDARAVTQAVLTAHRSRRGH